ncbi:MAG TPA: amino acid ABC transporter permease [Albitalea sp.]|nr:amino acid ABC transporter permease [Albitalea sp.]
MLTDVFDILRDNWLLLLVGQYPNGPLGGIACTLILSVLGIALAFPLSVGLALARLSPWRLLNWPATALVYVARGVPLLMIILWVYFLVPLVIGHNVSGFVTMLCTLVLYEGCYLAEVVRAGIEALPKGQMEAARALGHSHLGAMRLVILPQALFNMLPSMLSQFVSTIKETTLGYVINVPELTFAANQINNQLLTKPFQVFFILAVIYFVVCWTLTHAAKLLERRIGARRAGLTTAKTGKPAPVVVQPLSAEP